jgi:hypothetical protein
MFELRVDTIRLILSSPVVEFFFARIGYEFFSDSIKDLIENLQQLAKQKLKEKRTGGLLA